MDCCVIVVSPTIPLTTVLLGRLASGLFSGPNINLRSQGPMHGTLVSYFKKPGALFVVKIARQSDRALDTIDHSILGLAISAICSINPTVLKPDLRSQ